MSIGRAAVEGGIGFCLASLCVFATVAFAEGWMYRTLGIVGAYVAWTVLFMALGTLALRRLVDDPARRRRFPLCFGGAFFVYGALWTGAWFALRGAAGEWAGSLAGAVGLALVLAWGMAAPRAFTAMAALLFVANTAGYFLGSALNQGIGGAGGMLAWGGAYGLFLGMGLGAALQHAQRG